MAVTSVGKYGCKLRWQLIGSLSWFQKEERVEKGIEIVVNLPLSFDPLQIKMNYLLPVLDIFLAIPFISSLICVKSSQVKRLKAIMLAAAELAALRLRDLPMPNHRGYDLSQSRAFHLLDKNGDGHISIEELTDVMEELGAGGKDAQELMKLLDANSDGSLSSDEFDLFQKQIELARSLEDRDDHFRAMLGDKLQMTDSTGLIQVYRKELGDKLAVNSYFQHDDDEGMTLP